ncbi:hypothetical protein NUW54_g14380 [Trametes sanguinea]|uniref:Uncharacterized protein n=1 Tax=Trametes sanguinea TaxID=158606 RepID=A0ACC1MD30_9APHY|nr:hypothetical protein NUW54_g14380 [Trametes sanguinea]
MTSWRAQMLTCLMSGSRASVKQYFKSIVITLLTRMQTSKTDKYVYHFVYFLGFSLAIAREDITPDYIVVVADSGQLRDSAGAEDAADWLAKWRKWHDTERKGRCTACEKRTPLGVLAAILIRERLRKHAASLFVRTVVRAEDASRRANSAYDSEDECEEEPLYTFDAEKDFQEEQERKETVEAGKSIGGRTAELAILLERIWDTGFYTPDDALPAPRRRSGSDATRTRQRFGRCSPRR